MRPVSILIKIPSRERPEQLREVLDAVFLLRDPSVPTAVLVSADEDDDTMREFHYDHPITVIYGERTSKVGAINRDLERLPWDIVLVLSDDMVPVASGFNRIAFKGMLDFFPDFNGCLWLSDGRQERIPTIACMGRSYWYDHGKEVYDSRFDAYFCDDAQLMLAEREGRIERVPGPFAMHMHSMYNRPGAPAGPRMPDDLLRVNQARKARDKEMFDAWKKENGFK